MSADRVAAAGVQCGVPFVRPLYDTRPLEKSWATWRKRPRGDSERTRSRATPILAATFCRARRLWPDAAPEPALKSATARSPSPPRSSTATPPNSRCYFQPYCRLQFTTAAARTCRGCRNCPIPASSSIWGLPVEIDPEDRRARCSIANGDMVRVESPHGSLEAPAYVHPGAVPDVVSMAIGDGHTHYGRYASGRGANPLSILAPAWEKSPARWHGRHAREAVAHRRPRRQWIQFSAPDREEKEHSHR